ncbi:hypothetical protein [Streptomyces sp. NBC_00285]|uniref:hypothetical protein n=1 Tax=Streptomyces sp. NBC_00285 TaxID=2975700 RepID=UPI003FA777EA
MDPLPDVQRDVLARLPQQHDRAAPPLFLNSLRDGDTATLVFHFYSGQTATYQVTKNGSTVTGTVG